MCSAISSCFLGPAFGGCHPHNSIHVRLKLQYLPEVELSPTEPEASLAMVAIAMAPSAAAAAALVYAVV